jgi:hypothetical protein
MFSLIHILLHLNFRVSQKIISLPKFWLSTTSYLGWNRACSLRPYQVFTQWCWKVIFQIKSKCSYQRKGQLIWSNQKTHKSGGHLWLFLCLHDSFSLFKIMISFLLTFTNRTYEWAQYNIFVYAYNVYCKIELPFIHPSLPILTFFPISVNHYSIFRSIFFFASTYDREHIMFVGIWLISLNNVLQFYLFCCKWEYFVLYGWIIFHCVYTTFSTPTYLLMGTQDDSMLAI